MASPETYYAGPGDGHVGGGSNTSWALAIAQTTGEGGANTDYTTDNRPLLGWASNNAGDARTYFVIRGFLPFDTSALPDNAIITAATLGVYVTQKYSVASGSCCLVEGTQASFTALADADFDNIQSVELATRKTYASLTTSAYNTFALNTAGLALVNKAGYTVLAFRSSHDLDASSPSNTQYSGGYISTSEHTGTSQDPYLTITYSLYVTQGLAVAVNPRPTVTQGLGVAVTPRALYCVRGLQALWPLEETTGTNADDIGTLNADGTYSGTPTLAGGASPATSGSVYFNSADHLTITNQSALRFAATAAFTLEAWIKLDAVTSTNTRAIVQQADTTFPYAGWSFDVDTTGKLLLGRYDNGSPGYTFTTGTTTLSAATWTHVAVTYDGTNVRFYINGALDGSPSADSRSVTATTTQSLEIGNYITGYVVDASTLGSLSRVAISNVALTAAELLTHVPAVLTQGLAVGVYGTATTTQGLAVKNGSTPFPRWSRSLLPHAASASVVASPTSGAWDDYWVYGASPAFNSDGTIYQDGSGNYYVYYIGSSTSRNHSSGQSEDETGLLLTQDFETFTRWVSNPVLSFGATGVYNSGPWDDTDVQIGKVIVHSGTFYAFYCGNNVAGPGADYVRLGVATSTDGKTWTKHASNPVLSQGAGGSADELDLYTAGGVLYDADEADANKRWKWYYLGHSAAGVIRTMLATAPSPTGTWTKQAALTGIDPEGSGGSTYSPGITQIWKWNGVYYAIADDWYNLTASWVYASPDGLAWTKRAQVVTPSSIFGGAWDRSTSYYPVLFERTPGSGKWTYLYTGSAPGGTYPVYGIGVVEFMDAGLSQLAVSVAALLTATQGLAVRVITAGLTVTQGLAVVTAAAGSTVTQGLAVPTYGPSVITTTQGLCVRVFSDPSATVLRPEFLPAGTAVGAYRRYEWRGSESARLGAGPGAAVDTAVVRSDLTVEFLGLAVGEWVLYAPTFPNRRLFFMVTE